MWQLTLMLLLFVFLREVSKVAAILLTEKEDDNRVLTGMSNINTLL